MPKAWPMLASALNLQLGWGAKWKVLNESIAVALFVSIGAARMILAALTPKFELPLGSSSRIGSGCARAMCEVKSTHVEQLWPEQGALRRWAEGIGP